MLRLIVGLCNILNWVFILSQFIMNGFYSMYLEELIVFANGLLVAIEFWQTQNHEEIRIDIIHFVFK